jgi:hypothetical protein
MKSKWLGAALIALVPGVLAAQTEIAVENTGSVERPMAEGQVVPDVNYVHTILWTDSGAGSYDVHVSESLITDIGALDVYRIGTGIPAGQQAYEYPIQTPFAAQVGDVELYYAVTASGSSEVAGGVNATSSSTPGTREWSQPFFWFVDAPFIDGNLGDWTFDFVQLDPESPDNFAGGEIDNAEDFSGLAAMGVDADNVYMACDVTDDAFINVNESGSGDIWQGDAMEMYIGYYDLRPSDMYNPLSEFGNESDPSLARPDWQLAIAANAFDNPNRSHSFDGSAADNAGSFNRPLDQAGLEVATVDKGDGGWVIEASLPHVGMQFEPSLMDVFEPKIGMINNVTYVLNDGDDPSGGRQGQLFWSADESANNAWNTPASWQKHHTIYDPRVFGLGVPSTAVESASWGQIKAGVAQ